MAEPTGPATTLEDLTQTEDVVAPQDTTIVRADDATPAPSEHPLTAPMRVALDGSLALFVVVVGAPALIVVWAAVVCGGLALAGLGLTHAGALEPTTLPVAAAIGVGLGGLLAIAALFTRPAEFDAELEEDADHATATLIALTVSAGLSTAAALPRSAYFPYPLATILVSAAVTYLGLYGAVLVWHGTWGLARRARTWGRRSTYRAGFATAAFALLGLAGLVAHERRLWGPPVEALADELELARVDGPDGVFDAAPTVLCLAAGEVAPETARDEDAAPACTELPGSEVRDEQRCFEDLAGEPFRTTVRSLERTYGCGDECHDAAADALVATCHRRPPVDTPQAYFLQVARNNAKRLARHGSRMSVCSDLDERPADPCTWRDDEDAEQRTLALATEARCRMRPLEREVEARRWRGMSYAEIGQDLGMAEREARNLFGNMNRRLRRELKGLRARCEND
jgi:DNA-directed RNA polymerase specialized sigma24 family protein